MGLDKVVGHDSDVIASDVSDADGVGYVPDSHFRQLLKGLSKGLLELLRFGQVAPFLKIFFSDIFIQKNAALFKASNTVQWYGIEAILRPLIL